MKVKSSKVKSLVLILIVVIVTWSLFIPPVYLNYDVKFVNKYLHSRFKEGQKIIKEFTDQGIKAARLWIY